MRYGMLLALGLGIVVGCAKSEPPPLDETREGRVVARITGIRNGKGRLIARLYHGEDGFPSDAKKALREAKFEIRDGESTVTFDGLPYGEYAVWICHDEDEDGKLDTNFVGMPKEGAGVSGPPPSFIPKYSDARFDLGDPEHVIEIVLKYL